MRPRLPCVKLLSSTHHNYLSSLSQDYHRVVFDDSACIKRFHAKVNADPAAEVTAWASGQRSVTFRMPLNVPAMIKKLIGASMRDGYGSGVCEGVVVSA